MQGRYRRGTSKEQLADCGYTPPPDLGGEQFDHYGGKHDLMSKLGGKKSAVGSPVNEDVGVLNGIMWLGVIPLSSFSITAVFTMASD